MSICDDMAAALDRAVRERAGKRAITLPGQRSAGWVFRIGNLHAFAADMRSRHGPDVRLDNFMGWPVEPGNLCGVDVIWRAQ